MVSMPGWLHVHRTLSQALAHAVKAGVLFKNPAEQVKPPRPPSREIAILSKAEVATLLRAAEGSPLYLPVLVAVTTGMRRGELLGLRWSDIDLKAARLTVNQSLERSKGKTTFKSPKTHGSRRSITLPALTVEALKEHRSRQARIGAGELVLSHDGIPWDPDSLTKAFDRLIAATGVRRITFHGLRHTHWMGYTSRSLVSAQATPALAQRFLFTPPSFLRYKQTQLQA